MSGGSVVLCDHVGRGRHWEGEVDVFGIAGDSLCRSSGLGP